MAFLQVSQTGVMSSYVVQQGLYTIPGKKNSLTFIELCLVQPSLVAEFNEVCTQFEDRPAVYSTLRQTSKRMLDAALVGYRVRQVLYTIQGKNSSALIRLPKVCLCVPTHCDPHNCKKTSCTLILLARAGFCIFTYCGNYLLGRA